MVILAMLVAVKWRNRLPFPKIVFPRKTCMSPWGPARDLQTSPDVEFQVPEIEEQESSKKKKKKE